MRLAARHWYALTRGAAAIGFAVAVIMAVGMKWTTGTVGFVLLACLVEWLRLRLEPTGQATLLPLLIIVAFLARNIPLTLAAAMTGVVIVGAIVRREAASVVLERLGEESIPVLIASLVYYSAAPIFPRAYAAPGLVSAGTYIVTRFLVAGMRGALVDAISPRIFLRTSGQQLLVHLTICAALGLGLWYLQTEVGFFALALATMAVVEVYYPGKLLGEQQVALFATLGVIAQAIDLKDPYTARHSQNVARYAVRIARALEVPEAEVTKIRIGALMHDIGKIGVSGRIIRKATVLDPTETAVMRSHAEASADIIRPIELLGEAAEIVRHHHEHFDGSGYPDGLRGEQIPLGSRIILVADAFDAMTTDRPYRRGRTQEAARQVLKEHSGRQFDARVVKALESIIGLA